MKKILSLGLVAAMAMSAMPMAYATTAHTNGTQVEYVADADANRAYTITVPAKMTPKLGQAVTGTVVLEGKWASNETVIVTADPSVTLKNSINENDTHTLTVNLPKMEYAGNNTVSKRYEGTVTLAEMPAAALFGEWSGKFNYNVEFDDGLIEINLPYQPDSDDEIQTMTIKAKKGMTWREYVDSDGDNLSTVDATNRVILGLAYSVIDESNHYVSPDTVIDPNIHYELFIDIGDKEWSPSFGTTPPTWA